MLNALIIPYFLRVMTTTPSYLLYLIVICGFQPTSLVCKHAKEKMDFHSYRDLSSDEESDSRGSEGSCEDVSFGRDDDEVLVNVGMFGIPVKGLLHEPVGQDN